MTTAIPKTQWAVQLTGPDELILNKQKPVHQPGPHQILCRVEAVGLCFSDLKLLKQFSTHARKTDILSGIDPAVLDEIPSYVPADQPTVPGHESVVRVVAVGDQFFMWFLGNDGRQWRAGFATSLDGVHWTKSKANPILEGGNAEAWDSGSIWGLDVVRDGDRFHIRYSATDRQSRDPQTIRIGYAGSRPK